MSSKIAYLFGAGASYNAIPVVSGMQSRLTAFLDYFFNNRHLVKSESPGEFQRVQQLQIVDSIKELVIETGHSFSIDTLARKYFLRGDLNKLENIKSLISAFLLWEQVVYKGGRSRKNTRIDNGQNYSPSINYFSYAWKGTFNEPRSIQSTDVQLKNFDYRYESLLSVLAIDRNILNPNVSIISWNYDNQVEIAIDRIFNLTGDETEKNRLMDSILSRNFIKLNGSAGLSNFDWEPISRFNDDRENNLGEIANFLSGQQADFPNRIKFAWESDSDLPRNRAFQHLDEAEELVIVGYSFPDYNRQVDFQLLSEFWRRSPMKKITVQDIPENAGKVAQRIRSMTRSSEQADRIKVYTETDQFYIPPVYLAV